MGENVKLRRAPVRGAGGPPQKKTTGHFELSKSLIFGGIIMSVPDLRRIIGRENRNRVFQYYGQKKGWRE